MVHKVFTSGNGEELSILINHTNELYIRLENREERKELIMTLDIEDATELFNELGELVRLMDEKYRQ
jgi:hypothetical protein